MVIRRLSQICSLISLSLCILMCILFCFELKAWEFSLIALALIFAVCVLLCAIFTGIVISNQERPVTLFLITIVMLLLIAVELVSISFISEALKAIIL